MSEFIACRKRWECAVLIAMLMFALAIRLAWGLTRPSDDASINLLPDQREYLLLAENLLGEGELKFFDARFQQEVYAFRTPGYPLFVAMAGGNVRAARVLQAMVDASTVLAVYLLAMRLGVSRGAGLLAAGIVAVHPFLIYFSSLILTETLFTAMLAWGMVLLIDHKDGVRADAAKRGNWKWIVGGGILALSILVRPSAVGLPIVMGIAAAFVNHRRSPSYQRRWPLPVATTLLLLTLLVILPWGWRNHVRLGAWIWGTTNSGITAYDGFNPDATGASDQSFINAMPWLKHVNEVQRSQYLSDRAREFIRENPRRVAELTVKKIARTWSPIPLSKDYGGRRLYVAVGYLFSVPFFVLVGIGIWRGGIGDRRSEVGNQKEEFHRPPAPDPRPPIPGPLPSAKLFLLLPALYFTAVHALSVGSLRYRIPVEPPMAILAAAGAWQLMIDWWKRRTGDAQFRIADH